MFCAVVTVVAAIEGTELKLKRSALESQFYNNVHNKRTKRNVNIVIDKFIKTKILKDARLIYGGRTKRVYKKMGGFEQAVKDFEKLRPKNVGKHGNSMFGNNGEMTIFLENEFGLPVLRIWKVEKRRDGKKVKSIDKIEYFWFLFVWTLDC